MTKIILLIEDNFDVRENTAEILELAQYKVLQAQNGKEGVKLAQSEKPDLIICDIMMPELDGYGVLHLLLKDPETASIPFIFLTAKAEKTDYRKGMEMGADDYLTKPFDDMELLKAVETRFKKNEILKKEYAKNNEGLDEFFKEAKGLEELNRLSELRESKTYKKKEIIYTEDHYPRGIYFVDKGKVKTFKTSSDGKEYITGLYNDGDFFGYTALLEGGKYTDTAETIEQSEVTLINKDDFFMLLHNNRDVANKFIKLLSNNIVQQEEKLLQLAYNSVRKRAAEALVLLNERFNKNESPNFNISISRDDIASIVGTATETVIRTLSSFKDEGLIEIKGSNITILNVDKLSKMRN